MRELISHTQKWTDKTRVLRNYPPPDQRKDISWTIIINFNSKMHKKCTEEKSTNSTRPEARRTEHKILKTLLLKKLHHVQRKTTGCTIACISMCTSECTSAAPTCAPAKSISKVRINHCITYNMRKRVTLLHDVEERHHQRRTDSYQLQTQQSPRRTAQLPQNHGSEQPGVQNQMESGPARE